MTDVMQDLQEDEIRERNESKNMDNQIVSLVRKRDAVRRDEARKEREVSFLHSEIDRLERRLKHKSSVVSNSSETQAISSAQVQGALDVAASHSNQDSSTKEIAEAEAAAAEADKVISTGAEGVSVTTGTNEVATAPAVVASARLPVQAATHETKSALLPSERRQERFGQDDADSTDDSFKQFMKEEDGEDQIGDEAYEDSANALAGAIGWNRHDVEKNADSAVKQLTEAIGGKQVVRSVQGMMAGIR
jgi:hypothetical protein